MTVRLHDAVVLDRATIDAKGWLNVSAANLARVGCMTYQKHELGLPGNGNVVVYRDPGGVFDSFNGELGR